MLVRTTFKREVCLVFGRPSSALSLRPVVSVMVPTASDSQALEANHPTVVKPKDESHSVPSKAREASDGLASQHKLQQKHQSPQHSHETPKDVKLSNKELKAKSKAEKAQKRAQEKQGRQGETVAATPDERVADKSKQGKGHAQSKPTPAAAGKGHHRRKSSAGAHAPKGLPHRPAEPKSLSKQEEPKLEDKRVELFEHLYTHPRRHTIAGASKDIHPAILALGLQFSSYEVCGSNARCVYTMLALKEVILSYDTPSGTSLPRHLTTHLASQIDYLVQCRPLSVSQGNAIRWLKVMISAVDVGKAEDEAKNELCDAIENFIREKIVVADEVIASSAAERIRDGDVILSYAKSSIVEKTLLTAHSKGKKFKVIVVDSRPLFEGKNLVKTLSESGIEVEYSIITGLAHVAPRATIAFLGAHAMMANGSLFSRVGTAMVAMMAKEAHIPVVVCCESIKITERVALDSFVHNEIAPEDELIPPPTDEGDSVLEGWRDIPNLRLLNIMYDVTPGNLIDMVVTEYGPTAPISVMAIQRLSNNT